MPTGPKGEKRPADVIGNAVHVMRIATGEETDALPRCPVSYRRALLCGQLWPERCDQIVRDLLRRGAFHLKARDVSGCRL
jgi:hypothetical protein